jgi:uncharacterized protein YndB with AHSA1/START domain
MELTLHRTLPYPIKKVWAALTDAKAVAGWFWPEGFATVAEVDARPGGRYRIASAPMGMAVGGSFLTVEPARRLAFTWRWEGEDLVTRVSIGLEPGTALTLTHAGFPDEAQRDNHVAGWSDCLDRLPAWLDGNSAAG